MMMAVVLGGPTTLSILFVELELLLEGGKDIPKFGIRTQVFGGLGVANTPRPSRTGKDPGKSM